MRACPNCARAYPEVVGADEQRCPYCGHETRTPPADDAAASEAPFADPVGALVHASRFVARHYPRLLLLWLPVLVADVLAALALVAYQARTGLVDVADLSPDEALSLLGVALPLYFVDFAVTFAAWGLVAAHVLDPEGRAGGARAAFWKRVPGALAVGALMTLALLAGFVMLVIPFLVFLHLFLFAPAAHADGARVGEAFDHSRRFAKERATYGFTALVVLVGAILLGATYLLAGALHGALEGAGVGSPYVQAVFEVLPAWLLSPLLPVLPASYWRLAQLAETDASAQAGAPAATTAADRQRTTKCPRCGTLIQYAATGKPVEVKCPSCGASGRVL